MRITNNDDRVKDPELKEEAHEKFREIQEAYEILSELKKKRAKQNRSLYIIKVLYENIDLLTTNTGIIRDLVM